MGSFLPGVMPWCLTGSNNEQAPHLPQVPVLEASLGQRHLTENTGFEEKKGKEMIPQLTEEEERKEKKNPTTQIRSYF